MNGLESINDQYPDQMEQLREHQRVIKRKNEEAHRRARERIQKEIERIQNLSDEESDEREIEGNKFNNAQDEEMNDEE